MIRDFRAYSGLTPAEFARRLLPEGAGIADDRPEHSSNTGRRVPPTFES